MKIPGRSLWIGIALLGLATASRAAKPVVVDSPEIGEGGRVTFRLWAPEARVVELRALWAEGATRLTRGDDGVWTVATEVPAGFWEYNFVVDGLPMIDPSNPLTKPQRNPRTSLLEIAGPETAYLDFHDVPHGTVRSEVYWSEPLGKPRAMTVYTPPGYDENPAAR